MKRNSFMILFPLFAFGMELKSDSVSILLQEGVQTCSFFGKLPDGSLPMGLALAGVLTAALAVMAIVYAVTKKPPLLTALVWVSLAAATFSVLPILIRTEPPVMPNVGVALTLLMESLAAFLWKKEAVKETGKPITL